MPLDSFGYPHEKYNSVHSFSSFKEQLEKTKFDIDHFIAKRKKDLNKIRMLSSDQILWVLYQDLLSYKEFKEYSDNFVSHVKWKGQKIWHETMFYFLMEQWYFINQTYNEWWYDHFFIPCIRKQRDLKINNSVLDGMKNNITHYFEINDPHFKSAWRTQYDCIVYNKAINLEHYHNFSEWSVLINELVHRYLNMRVWNYNDLSLEQQEIHELMSDLGMMMEYPKTIAYYAVWWVQSKISWLSVEFWKEEYKKTHEFISKICESALTMVQWKKYWIIDIAAILLKSKYYINTNELFNDVLPYFDRYFKIFITTEFTSNLSKMIAPK